MELVFLLRRELKWSIRGLAIHGAEGGGRGGFGTIKNLGVWYGIIFEVWVHFFDPVT
jgi:hypothetical protein